MTMRGPWAGLRDTPGCSVSVGSVGEFARHVHAGARGPNRSVHAGDRMRHSLRDASRFPAAREHSAGTRCCRHRRAARGCRRERSGTSASPARRCGSILSVSVYVALLTNRVHPTPDNNAITPVRPALHDAIIDAL